MRHALFASCLTSCLICVAPAFAAITLDATMSQQDQMRTGVSKLTPAQKQALETWLNANFQPKGTPAAMAAPASPDQPEKRLYLSENINNGKSIRLTDGSLYAIAPQDQVHTALWITPFPIKIETSGDADYPVKITNEYSGTSVKAKLLEPAGS